MHQLFRRANESLYSDLESYASALRRIVDALPQARLLCDQILREVRLAEALLAFGSGQQVIELRQLTFHLADLWPFREHGPTRTSGFSDEIAEAERHTEQVKKALAMLGRLSDDALGGELKLCFNNILKHLEEERRLLVECHAAITPFSANSDLTRKRLNLLVAAAEARLPDSSDRRTAIATYGEAADLLKSWEGGVPIDEHGVAILNRCISLLGASSEIFGILSVSARSTIIDE